MFLITLISGPSLRRTVSLEFDRAGDRISQ